MSFAAVVAPLQPARMVPKATKGKVAHLSASRNRQPSYEAHQQAADVWENRFCCLLPRGGRARRADCCRTLCRRHHDGVGPGRTVAAFEALTIRAAEPP